MIEKMNIRDCLEIVNDTTFEVYRALTAMVEEIRKGKNADLIALKKFADEAMAGMVTIDAKTNETADWAEML